MTKKLWMLPLIIMTCLLMACGSTAEQTVKEPETTEVDTQVEVAEDETANGEMPAATVKNEAGEKQENESDMVKLIIEVNGHRLTATLADNSSAEALMALLEKEPVTINMHDFSNFEKVGDLPQELPTNDEQIDTDYGDLILYLGKSFVIYYDKNSWNFTRLGHIDDITQDELKSILGNGDVTAVLSMGD